MRNSEQLTTFYVGDSLFGIDVMKVQEVTGKTNFTHVPRAPHFICGLINLRGQIATAVNLGALFSDKTDLGLRESQMTVVCHFEGGLVSLIVDSIGDVVEVDRKQFEKTPEILAANIRKYIRGIYKLDDGLMSVLDIDKIFEELLPESKGNKGEI